MPRGDEHDFHVWLFQTPGDWTRTLDGVAGDAGRSDSRRSRIPSVPDRVPAHGDRGGEPGDRPARRVTWIPG